MIELPLVCRRIGLAATLSVLFALGACGENQKTGRPVATLGETGPVVAPATGLIGDHDSRTQQLLGAGIGAIAAADVAGYADRLEAEMQRRTAGTGIDLERRGNELLLAIPARIAFDPGAAAIKPGIRTTLDAMARAIAQYGKGYVDVSGYAEVTSDEGGSLTLARNQAQALADYLRLRGVQPVRLASQGYNRSAASPGAGQRVEIKLVPLTTADLPPPPPPPPASVAR